MGRGRKYILSDRVNEDIDLMEKWLEESNLKDRTIASYLSRFREFAAWYEERAGRGVELNDLDENLLKEYEHYLRGKYPRSDAISSRMRPIQLYNYWGVETGRLPNQKPHPKRADPFEGEEEFTDWMLATGRKPSTTQAQVYILRSMNKWLIDQGEGKLTPHNTTPYLLLEYWEDANRSDNVFGHGQAAAHNYVLWAMERSILVEDPFEDLTRWSRRATEGNWRLIERKEALEFIQWIQKDASVDKDTAYRRAQNITTFLKWYYLTQGKMVTYTEVEQELYRDYEDYLWQTEIPPAERNTMAGSTINLKLYAARLFMRWVKHKKEEERKKSEI
jgi:hypothetical protein